MTVARSMRQCGGRPRAGSTGSFVRSLRVIRRQVIAHPTVSPDQIGAIHCAIEELLTRLLPPRRLRPGTLTPTAVKHNMSNDQLKRAQHRIWPQPTMPPSKAVSILPPADLAPAVEGPHQMALVLAGTCLPIPGSWLPEPTAAP